MRALKITGIVVGSLVLLAGIGLIIGKVQLDRGFYEYYDPTLALDAELIEVSERESGAIVEKLYFQTTPGERVPTWLTRPADLEGRAPAVIFLHGIGQSGDFVQQISDPFNEAGFIMVSYDQYMRGERNPDEDGILDQVQQFRRRASSTVVDTRRLIDYLQTRTDVDDERIYLVGASYGAITGSVAAAKDARIRATVLVYGGGNLNALLSAPYVKEEMGASLLLAKPLANYLLGVADPVRYVGGIAPRPVFFQNGEEDGLVAPPAARALYEAARDPKQIKWYPGDHIGLDEDTVREVLADGLSWLQDQDARVRAQRGDPDAEEAPAAAA